MFIGRNTNAYELMSTEKVCLSIPGFEYSHHTQTKGRKNSSDNGLERKGCSSSIFLHSKQTEREREGENHQRCPSKLFVQNISKQQSRPSVTEVWLGSPSNHLDLLFLCKHEYKVRLSGHWKSKTRYVCLAWRSARTFCNHNTSFKDQLHTTKQGEVRPHMEIGREMPGYTCAVILRRASYGCSQRPGLPKGGTEGVTCLVIQDDVE